MDIYGTFKHMATENYYVVLSKCLNSSVCTEETQQTIKRITSKSIKYAHMGQLIIHEGICYASFRTRAMTVKVIAAQPAGLSWRYFR